MSWALSRGEIFALIIIGAGVLVGAAEWIYLPQNAIGGIIRGVHSPANSEAAATPPDLENQRAMIVAAPLFTKGRAPIVPPNAAGEIVLGDNVKLVGIIIDGGQREALFEPKKGAALIERHEGEMFGDWSIKTIGSDEILLSKDNVDKRLALYPEAAPAESFVSDEKNPSIRDDDGELVAPPATVLTIKVPENAIEGVPAVTVPIPYRPKLSERSVDQTMAFQ